MVENHDAAGIEADEKISDSLAEKGHYAVGRALPKNKDWNEDLKARHGLEPLPAEEHPQRLLRDEICEEVGELCRGKKNADCSAVAFGRQGVITQTEKLKLAESYETVAANCLKAVITLELEQQKLEQCQAPEMAMTM